jgi:hypothetical protein
MCKLKMRLNLPMSNFRRKSELNLSCSEAFKLKPVFNAVWHVLLINVIYIFLKKPKQETTDVLVNINSSYSVNINHANKSISQGP